MAFTQNDLSAIDSAIASGELTVRTADGKLVTLRSVSELLQARTAISTSLSNEASAGLVARMYPRHQLADFSD